MVTRRPSAATSAAAGADAARGERARLLRPPGAVGLVAVLLLAAGAFLPDWAMFLGLMGLAKGLVVLGLMVLWRTGLVSFGQGLFYGLGAYVAGVVPTWTGLSDAVALVAVGALVATVVAVALGFLLAQYREIFFAMLCLAFSMIFYGILVKTEALGSTDGFNVVHATYLGYVPEGRGRLLALYLLTAVLVAAAGGFVHRYLRSTLGHLTRAVRDNEIRVEYLGFPVRRVVHFEFTLAGALAGAGGVIAALAIGHVDPEMVWWIQSGEFVFVTILSGTGHVIAPFLGSIVFELLRTFALQYAPNFWQIMFGGALLLVIVFLPGGLWSLFARAAAGSEEARGDAGHP